MNNNRYKVIEQMVKRAKSNSENNKRIYGNIANVATIEQMFAEKIVIEQIAKE